MYNIHTVYIDVKKYASDWISWFHPFRTSPQSEFSNYIFHLKITPISKGQWFSKPPSLKMGSKCRFSREYWTGSYLGTTPHLVTVSTRIIPFLVGNPYKPSFVTVTGWGVDQNHIFRTLVLFGKTFVDKPRDKGSPSFSPWKLTQGLLKVMRIWKLGKFWGLSIYKMWLWVYIFWNPLIFFGGGCSPKKRPSKKGVFHAVALWLDMLP